MKALVTFFKRNHLESLIAINIFALGIAGNLLLFAHNIDEIHYEPVRQYEQKTEDIVDFIHKEIELNTTHIKSIKNTIELDTDQVLSYAEWNQINEVFETQQFHPGISSIGLVKKVDHHEVKNFLNALKVELAEFELDIDGSTYPESETSHYIFKYIYPLTPDRLSVIGYDLSNDPVRELALQKSDTLKSPAATRHMLLRSDSYGFWVTIPVNAQNSEKYFMILAYRTSDFFDYVFENFDEENIAKIYVYSGQENFELVYETDKTQSDVAYIETSKTFMIADQIWEVRTYHETNRSPNLSLIYLLIGNLIVGFISWLMYTSIKY